MAGVNFNITVVHKNGTGVYNISTTSGRFLNLLHVVQNGSINSAGVSKMSGNDGTGDEIGFSLTEGGNAVDLDNSIYATVGDNETTIYALYPEPSAEIITGFYLDGTEYKFEGGGGTADGISTTQPSNPVAGSTYYDTTNKVVKVYNGTSWEEVGGGNVIAMTQAEYDALPAATKNDGKLRIITDATGIEMADKAYVDGLVGDIETLLAAL